MDSAYIIYFGGVSVGLLALMGVMYFIYRRGIAMRLTLIMLGMMLPPALASFYLGKEGITLISITAVVAILLPVIIGMLVLMVRQIINPLKELTVAADQAEMDLRTLAVEMNGLAQGDLTRSLSVSAKTLKINSKDEIGQMAGAFNAMIIRLQETGNAFAQTVFNLGGLIGQVAENALSVEEASAHMAAASGQAGEASIQIAATIQQIALGAAQQTVGVTKTSASVGQMGRAIDGVAKGAQEQARAIAQASQITSRINTAIEQVANNVQSVTRDSAQSASYSRDGAKTVKETINSMEAIRSKVGLTASKVEEMGTRSEEIGDIVETIEDIAAQTNLLALNAAIEAARASGAGAKVSEELLQQHLLAAADMLAELFVKNGGPLHDWELAKLAQQARIETFNISDEDGVIVLSNVTDSIGFRFPEDEKQQAAVFRPLLKQPDGVVVQSAQPRSQDGIMYMYAGVSRRDQRGIVQAGMPAAALEKSGNYTRGFAVVADEVRKLAERSTLATKNIATLIKGIQKTVSDAVIAMKASAEEVEAGVTRAYSAGEALENILGAAESVYKQAEDAGAAAAKVRDAANELVEAVDSVSAVIEENTAATEEMAANSSELTQAIENIASVSEENSAAVEEVSASTEEVSAQVEEVSASAASLMEMAKKLQEVVSRFKLNL